jgi:hypothetical protein
VLGRTDLHATEFWVLSPGEGRNVSDQRTLSSEMPAVGLKSSG